MLIYSIPCENGLRRIKMIFKTEPLLEHSFGKKGHLQYIISHNTKRQTSFLFPVKFEKLELTPF